MHAIHNFRLYLDVQSQEGILNLEYSIGLVSQGTLPYTSSVRLSHLDEPDVSDAFDINDELYFDPTNRSSFPRAVSVVADGSDVYYLSEDHRATESISPVEVMLEIATTDENWKDLPDLMNELRVSVDPEKGFGFSRVFVQQVYPENMLEDADIGYSAKDLERLIDPIAGIGVIELPDVTDLKVNVEHPYAAAIFEIMFQESDLVDFTGDGVVDANDYALLLAHEGLVGESRYDFISAEGLGFPDEVVDANELDYFFETYPDAWYPKDDVVSDLCSLTISCDIGGAVTAPGAGTYSYPWGTVVQIEAAADVGYTFTGWGGSAAAGQVADPFSANTTVTVSNDGTLHAGFREILVDPPIGPAPAGWAQTYGGSGVESLFDLCPAPGGGYVATGRTTSTSDHREDVYLIKVDESGELLWERTLGTFGPAEWGRAIEPTADGGYAIAGDRNSDMYLIKTDGNGELLWETSFGGSAYDIAHGLAVLPDGAMVLAGVTKSMGAGVEDCFLVKTDAFGGLIWQKTYGGPRTDLGEAVIVTVQGDYVVGGITKSLGSGNFDLWVFKTDSQGTVLWERTFGGAATDYFGDVQETSDGGCIVVGTFADSDMAVIKLDHDGNTQWDATLGGAGVQTGAAAVQTAGGGYMVLGTNWAIGPGSEDIWVVQLDETGGAVADQTFGAAGRDYGYALIQTPQQDFIIAGHTYVNAQNVDGYLIRFSEADL